MKQLTLEKISFLSYLKLLFFLGLGVGLGIGLITLTISIFGGNANANIGSLQFEGITAGLLSLIISPLTGGLTFSFLGILGFIPFKILLSSSEGIQLHIDGTAVEIYDEHDTKIV